MAYQRGRIYANTEKITDHAATIAGIAGELFSEIENLQTTLASQLHDWGEGTSSRQEYNVIMTAIQTDIEKMAASLEGHGKFAGQAAVAMAENEARNAKRFHFLR